MIRYLSLAELANETFYADKVQCFKQIWEDGERWPHYMKRPRFSNGISLVCSDVEVSYTLPDGTVLRASRGDAVVVPRESQYLVSFRNGGRETDLFTVNFRLLDRDNHEIRLSREVEIIPGAASQLCNSVAEELADVCLLSGTKLRKQALLLRLLDFLSAHSQRHSETFYPIRHGVSLMIKEYNKNEKISYYAEQCGISERNFYNLFKKWSGQTPVDYRNHLRVTAAASLLIGTTLSVSEIAFKTGFDDPYYFSRVFKKFRGISPAEYRKNGSESGGPKSK